MNYTITKPKNRYTMSPVKEEGEEQEKSSHMFQSTDFESFTIVEPMDGVCCVQDVPLELSFEDHGNVAVSQCAGDVTCNSKDAQKKRTSFAEHPEVVNYSKENVADVYEGTANHYEVLEKMDDSQVEEYLAEKFDNVSVSTHSEYSEEIYNQQTAPITSQARLEQITSRIFATFLPENESGEQRHCDLVQAQRQLAELTNCAESLVINCGEANAQILATFKRVQNCPFDLSSIPDLATFIAFCERVHDWLMMSETQVLLLHAEGDVARARTLLLLRALSAYYEGSERFDSSISQNLRRYLTSYLNGLVRLPTAWLRYTGYMRMHSPENCLSILRSTMGIYSIAMYNYPVFEENKLRLFFKFYSGSPLRFIYTTNIHDFPGASFCNLRVNILATLDGKPVNTGLRLQGDITVIAYHARPYPRKRLRLFRLHFHSCHAAFTEPLTFQLEDFDDLCNAFPSTMRLDLHCSSIGHIKDAVHTAVCDETVDLTILGKQQIKSAHNSISPLSNSDGMLSPDDAVRHHDSLENLSSRSTLSKPRLTSLNSFEAIESWAQDARRPFVKVRQDVDNINRENQPIPDNNQQSSEFKETAGNHSRRFKAIFSSFKEKKEKPPVERPKVTVHLDDELLNPQAHELMPPPRGTAVPRPQKRKQTVGRRIFDILSGRFNQEEISDVESQDSISNEYNRSHTDKFSETGSLGSLKGLLSSFRKSSFNDRKTKAKREPPRKLRKTEYGSQVTSPLLTQSYSEDLLEAARRLNFMAGTQELDRLLEELRLTSMQMTAGLPPPNPNYYPKSYSASSSSYANPVGHRQPSTFTGSHVQTRYQATRSSSAIGLYGAGGTTQDHGSRAYSAAPSSYNYHRQSSTYQTERRTDGLSKPRHFPAYQPSISPLSTQRHHTTYTTVLKQRPPAFPKQMAQVHLTIDPDCGTTENSQASSSFMHDRDVLRREQRLESELNSARREIAQLRRAMSLVEERQRSEYTDELRSNVTSSNLSGVRSPSSLHQTFMSSSSSYQTQQNGALLGSTTFQRASPRQNGSYTGAFPLTKRAMSHTNVHGPRTWNLRSHLQGSESELAYKRVTSVSNPSGRSGYSAHRERLKQERENELLMRHQRQLAASSIGLNEQHLHQQTRYQQQYRSMSAVNTGTVSDAVEEIETIILQPIGRGVQDIDSRTGSMTTLGRAGGGSLVDGLNRMDNTQRMGLSGRGYSSTQFLNRTTPTSELIRPIPIHQSQTMIAPNVNPQPPQTPRFGTPTPLVNNIQSSQFDGSHSQLSTTSSTIVAAPPNQTASNGWKQETQKKPHNDAVDANNLGIVQDTAPSWYRPNLSRESAIRILRQQPPGSFLIRDSTTFKGAFGLAVKVATLPPKVTPKSDDLQSELVRHYLIEVVNVPAKGVRLKGFASEPVFPSLAALIHRHTYDSLALPCLLILPPVPTNLPSSGSATLPPLVIGTHSNTNNVEQNRTSSHTGSGAGGLDNVTVTSSGSMPEPGATSSDLGSVNHMDELMKTSRSEMIPANTNDGNIVSSQNVPFVCVLRESPTHQRRTSDVGVGQGLTFRCLMLGSVDTPQWDGEVCFARSVDQLIPLTVLTAAECDNGISRVRYTEVQLHVSAHDGITIIDLQRRLFLRRHLPNHILIYCGVEPRKKEFQHPEHQTQGIIHPQIFGIVVRKGISECTTHVFSECEPTHTAATIVQHIRTTYPHLNVR